MVDKIFPFFKLKAFLIATVTVAIYVLYYCRKKSGSCIDTFLLLVFAIKNLPMTLSSEVFTFGEVSNGYVRVTYSEDLLRNQLAQGKDQTLYHCIKALLFLKVNNQTLIVTVQEEY